MTSPDTRVSITSDPRLLKAVRGLIRGYMNGLDFPYDRIEEIVLAVDEACSNAMRHSYCGSHDGVIEIELKSGERDVVIELRDYGVPVAEEHVQRKNVQAPDLDTLRPGGLGIQLIFEVFDDVEFTPGVDCGNHVVMRLRRPEAAHERDCSATKGL